MGVKGLQFFVEKVCNDVCIDVSIPQLADHHRHIHGYVQQPVLVVDGMSLIHRLYARHFDWICGGQWLQFVTLLRDFVQRFDAAGVKLVFFFDGSVCPEKRHEWVSRRVRKMQDIQDLFRSMSRSRGELPDSKDFQAPASMGTFIRFTLKFACNAEVYSTTKEADLEVADYAVKNDAVFAILGQDTDFLIYDTKHYISAAHLDTENLTSVLYDRTMLTRRLLLNVQQLPLFSCLLGNDVISVDLLKPFHRRLCELHGSRQRGIDVLAPAVSHLIREKRWKGDFRYAAELREICQEVFGQNQMAQLVYDGLKFYCLFDDGVPNNSSGAPEMVRQRHIRCENFPAVFNMLQNLEYECSEVLEDAADLSLPPTNTAFRSIRQRAYSIIFQATRVQAEQIVVKEWCAVPGNTLARPEFVHPLPVQVPGGIPKLEDLWCNISVHARDVRVECFLCCLGGPLKISHLLSVRPQYIALCCTLNYLLSFGHDRRPLLAPWEVIAFIAQALLLQGKDITSMDKLQVPIIDTRGVHLASLFMRGIVNLGMVLGVCGYPFPITDFMPWNFFDGKLFHVTYLHAKIGACIEDLCERKVEMINEFYNLLSVVTFGTSLNNVKMFTTR